MLDDYDSKKEYLREIVNAYLLKDILSIDDIKNSSKMKDLLRLIAFQSGNEVSYDELGRQLGLSRNTVEKYLDLLSKVFVVYKLGAYSGNMRKEVSKAGKWYFYDIGIRNALIGNFNSLTSRQDAGILWESYMIAERIKLNAYNQQHKDFYFWRTYDGQEIDLIEHMGDTLSDFEFKWGSSRQPKSPRGFITNYPDASFDIVNLENYTDYMFFR